MKVLFLTHAQEDYLQDQVLIGLRRLLGTDCIEYPRKDILYKDCTHSKEELYGRGFTIWKTLDPVGVDRTNCYEDLRKGQFDLVIFGSIRRQKDLFDKFVNKSIFENLDTQFAFLDGEDIIVERSESFYQTVKRLINHYAPYEFSQYVKPVFYPALRYGPYLKREIANSIVEDRYKCPLIPVSFSIPKEKISLEVPPKSQMYPSQVQCKECHKIDEIRNKSTTKHIFEKEDEYYNDLKRSKYGITQKKSGWECMRHYEIAANMSVPCFYKLSEKPFLSAPHGLKDMYNCISFATASELSAKVQYIENKNIYYWMISNVSSWVGRHTCEKVANRILIKIGFHSQL